MATNEWGDEILEPGATMTPPTMTPPTSAAPPIAAAPAAAPKINEWGDEITVAAPRPGFFGRIKDSYAGASRTDPAYADAPEFLQAQMAQKKGPNGELPVIDPTATMRSAIAPTEEGQLDILKKNIPGLETQRDAKGNLMLKAPGMDKWTYLNKPGFSARDMDELTTQGLATLPFGGIAGLGEGILARMGLGAAGMAAGSVAQDAMAQAAGSEQAIDPTKAVVSGALGAALPGIVEPVAKGVASVLGAAARYPASRIRGAFNPDAQATLDVNAALAADRSFPRGTPLNAAEARGAAQNGQDLRVIDTGGEATRALSRSAANQSPEARSLIGNMVDDRLEGQSTRVENFIRDLVARPGQAGGPNASMTRDALQAAGRAARDPLYTASYQAGAQGILSPILTKIARAPAMQEPMREAAQTILNRKAIGTTTGMKGAQGGFTLEYWDMVKRSLDDKISVLKRTGANSAAMDLDGIRRSLVSELDKAVPEFATARGTAQTFFKADDALTAGESFVNGKFDAAASRKALAAMTPQERDLFAEGFASRFIEQVRKVGDRRSLLNSINNSPAARERLSIALGPNRARSMEAFMRVEGIMDLVRSAQGNSSTARQLVELGMIGGAGYQGGDTEGGLLAIALTMGNRAINRRIATRVAQQLLSSNPAQVQTALRQVGSTPMMDALRSFDKLMVRSGVASQAAQEASPSPGGPAPAARPAQGAPAVPRIAPQAPSAPAAQPQRGAGLQDAQRMAQQAIAQGAPPEAVNARLAAYMRANDLSDAAVA